LGGRESKEVDVCSLLGVRERGGERWGTHLDVVAIMTTQVAFCEGLRPWRLGSVCCGRYFDGKIVEPTLALAYSCGKGDALCG